MKKVFLSVFFVLATGTAYAQDIIESAPTVADTSVCVAGGCLTGIGAGLAIFLMGVITLCTYLVKLPYFSKPENQNKRIVKLIHKISKAEVKKK